jgi:hypothetical protein
MKKISHKERQRILELHHKTPMKPYLFEHNGLLKKIQAQTDASLTSNKIYDKTNTPNQIPKEKLSQPQINSIKQYVDDNASREIPTWPFKNNVEGDYFRQWVNTKYPELAGSLQLDKNGKYTNSYYNDVIKKAWNYPFRIHKVEKILGEWFIDSLKFDKYKPQFYQRMLPLLEKAKTWWRNWLTNPETRTKFKKLNYIFFDSIVDVIFYKYFDSINKLELVIVNNDFYKDMSNVFAMVLKKTPNKIYVNYGMYATDDSEWVSTFVHEIQHLLYWIKPMTPDISITEFKGSDDCYKKNREIYNNTKIEDRDKLLQLKIDDEKINLIANDLGFDINKTNQLVNNILHIAYNGYDESYFRDNKSELTSRVQGTREHLLQNSNKSNLTKEHFIKYFNGENSNDDVDYILGYWASKGFPSLESFANELNTSFVKTDQKNIKNSPTDLPYKSKEGIV